MPQDPFGEPHFLNQTLLQVPRPWKQKSKAIPPLTFWVSFPKVGNGSSKPTVTCIFQGFSFALSCYVSLGGSIPRKWCPRLNWKNFQLANLQLPQASRRWWILFFGYPKSRWSSKVGDDTVTGCLEWFPKKTQTYFLILRWVSLLLLFIFLIRGVLIVLLISIPLF